MAGVENAARGGKKLRKIGIFENRWQWLAARIYSIRHRILLIYNTLPPPEMQK